MIEKRKIFIQPVLKGDRFGNASIPHKILTDLEAYITIIIAVAKELYKKNNPTKTRLPKGFEDRFILDLTEVKPGSAIPIYKRNYEQDAYIDDEFDRARDLVNAQIQDSSHCLTDFPSVVIPLFESFGKHLKPEETIELKIPDIPAAPIYSREVRSKILSINKKPYQDTCFLSGCISGFDVKKGIFYLVLESNQITGPLEGSFDISLRDIASKYNREEIIVTLVGLAKYDPDGSISHIDKLQHITIFKDPEKIYLPDPFNRIDEFLKLENGWLEGKGSEYKKENLDIVKKWLSILLSKDTIPAPFVFPSPDNLLEAEWSFGFWEIICSFDFEKNTIILHATNVSSEEVCEDKLTLDDPHSTEQAIRFLIQFLNSYEE